MVDLPTQKTIPLDTIQAPQERVSGGDVQRSGQAIASGLGELGKGLEDVSVPLAQNQAAADLQKVTLDANGNPQVATPSTSFLFGRAGEEYAHAAAAGAVAAQGNEISQHMADLHQQFPLDPQGFRDAASSWLKTKTAGLSGPVQQAVAQEGAQAITGHYDHLVNAKAANDVVVAKGSIDANIASQKNQMIGIARQLGTSDPKFDDARAKYESGLDQLAANPRFGVSKEQVQLQKEQTASLMQGEALVAHLDQTLTKKGRAEAEKILTEGVWNNPKLEESDRYRLYRIGISHLQSQTEGQKAQWEANKGTTTAMEEALRNGPAHGGVAPDDPSVDAWLKHSIDSGDTTSADRVRAARDAVPGYHSFGGISGKQVSGLYDTPTPGSTTPSDARDLLIRTIYGEAGNEPDEGKAAVAHVIKNRLQSGQYGKDLSSVIMAPKQFSLWNAGDRAGDAARKLSPDSPAYQRIGQIVDGVMTGRVADPTGGADHYYNPHVASPDWGDKLASRNDVTIGNHRFVGRVGGTEDKADTAANAARLPPTDPNTTETAGTGKMTDWERKYGYGSTPQAGYAGHAGPPTPADLHANPFSMEAYLNQIRANKSGRADAALKIGEAAENAFKGGNIPAPEAVAQVLQEAAAAPDNTNLGTIAAKLKGYMEADALSTTMPGSVGKAYVDQVFAAANGQSLYEITSAQALRDQFARRDKALEEHPLTESAARGWTAPAPALNPRDPAAFAAAIAQRAAIATTIGARTRASPPSIFDPAADLPMVKNVIANGTADQKLALLDPLSKLPDAVRTATFKGLGDDADGRVFAAAGNVNQYDPQAAADILKGQELLKATPKLGPKSEDSFLASAASLPQTLFGEGVRSGVTAAAQALYAKASADALDTTQAFDQKRWDAAVDKVTGGVADLFGSTVIVPSYGMSESGFRQRVGAITDADLAGTRLGNGQPLPAASLQPGMFGSAPFKLQSYGPGKYLIYSGNPGSGSYVRHDVLDGRDRGGPFVLDLSGGPTQPVSRDPNSYYPSTAG